MKDNYHLTFWQEKCTGRIVQSIYREEYTRHVVVKRKKYSSDAVRIKFRYVSKHGVMKELYENKLEPWSYDWDDEEEKVQAEEKKNHWLSEELFLLNYRHYGKELKKLDFFEQH